MGSGVAETMRHFKGEKDGIGDITRLQTIHKGQLPVAEVDLSNEELSDLLAFTKSRSRTVLLGLLAAREAVANFPLPFSAFKSGLISGTTVGGMDRTEDFFMEFLNDSTKGKLRDVVHHECGMSTELMAAELGIRDYISTINTACSSSVNSIIYGSRLIKHGFLDVVIAGGVDSLTRFTINGFNSLMILDKNPCRPYDQMRAGLNLGEGAGYVILVGEKIRRQLKLTSLGRVSGYANTNDSYHQTASSPEGKGSFLAMTGALKMAGLSTKDIDYINLHGTGTQNNDHSEGTAIQRLFSSPFPKISSTKSFTGHTLGASGGIEAVFSVLAIRESCVFPNLRFENTIPEFSFLPQQTFESGITIRHVMSNSFGFGGNCSSIIFSNQDEHVH